MRTFISINLPYRIKDKISEMAKEFQEKGIRKVGKQNLHLTLKFLGDADEKKIEEIQQVLKTVDCAKFEISLKNIGFFPNKDFIKVVWVGIENGRNEIIELQKQIDQKLEKCGFKPEKKYEPHLTIARVKSIKDRKEFLEKLKEIKFEDNFNVSNFELMESKLNPSGPVYRVLLTKELV
ncbi:MAG: RNA 2',3'-cyclic phosphodiesterase [Candidatus Aenigmatarchaeota archaeon]|nr:MAG: RNA 2',3'-cyclic phosphodiesterase [Candidatus Aenigmarchaeota archaeon]